MSTYINFPFGELCLFKDRFELITPRVNWITLGQTVFHNLVVRVVLVVYMFMSFQYIPFIGP